MKSLIKIIIRWIKVVIGKDLMVIRDLKCHKVKIGSQYGGWVVNDLILHKNSIVYSFGVGTDISFDLGLIERFDLTVFGFDPTSQSIAWVKQQQLPSNFKLQEYGVSDFDGFAKFFSPENPNHISHSLLPRVSKGKTIDVPFKKLKTIMVELGHAHIDVLKLDIEGSEYDVIEDVKANNIRPTQFLVEFHHRFPGIGVKKTKQAIQLIRSMGYRLFHVSSSGEEYSFLLSLENS